MIDSCFNVCIGYVPHKKEIRNIRAQTNQSTARLKTSYLRKLRHLNGMTMDDLWVFWTFELLIYLKKKNKRHPSSDKLEQGKIIAIIKIIKIIVFENGGISIGAFLIFCGYTVHFHSTFVAVKKLEMRFECSAAFVRRLLLRCAISKLTARKRQRHSLFIYCGRVFVTLYLLYTIPLVFTGQF